MAKNVATRKDAEIRVLLLRGAPTRTPSRSALRKAANHGIPGICLVWRADRSRTRTRIACTAPARRRRGVLPPEPSGWHAGDRLRHHAGRVPTRARATTRNEAAPTTPPRDRGETPRPIVDRRIAPAHSRRFFKSADRREQSVSQDQQAHPGLDRQGVIEESERANRAVVGKPVQEHRTRDCQPLRRE